jgi:hypothetical protein
MKKSNIDSHVINLRDFFCREEENLTHEECVKNWGRMD